MKNTADQNKGFTAVTDNELEIVNGGTGYVPCFVYVVKKGDCLSILASKYHTTVAILCEINDIRNPDAICAGNKLLIPCYEEGTV